MMTQKCLQGDRKQFQGVNMDLVEDSFGYGGEVKSGVGDGTDWP